MSVAKASPYLKAVYALITSERWSLCPWDNDVETPQSHSFIHDAPKKAG